MDREHQSNNYQKLVALFALVVVFTVLISVCLSAYSTPKSQVLSSSTSAYKMNLSLVSPASTVAAVPGDTITIKLTAVLPTTDIISNPSTAALEFKFDPTILKALDIDPGTNATTSNESISNSLGQLSLELAHSSSGNFSGDEHLVSLDFELLDQTPDYVNVYLVESSELGDPDVFDYAGSTHTLRINLNTYCGDGITQNPNSKAVKEQCDDANSSNSDSCSNICLKITSLSSSSSSNTGKFSHEFPASSRSSSSSTTSDISVSDSITTSRSSSSGSSLNINLSSPSVVAILVGGALIAVSLISLGTILLMGKTSHDD